MVGFGEFPEPMWIYNPAQHGARYDGEGFDRLASLCISHGSPKAQDGEEGHDRLFV